MGVWLALLLFVLGLFLIINGGDLLVKAALLLNKTTGINQVVIGATFVAVATTLPEVFVSIFAVAAGNHGIAAGNAIGAMIANVALVLALPIVLLPGSIRREETLWKTLFLIFVTVAVFLFALNLEISWFEGSILLALFVTFLISNTRPEKGEAKLLETPSPKADEKLAGRGAWYRILFGFLAGQVMLCIGAFTLVENGENLAHFFNISETVVGFTVIAVGTSLPELITAVTSVRKKSGALAIGNVIGANVINCTLLIGVCGVIGDIKGEYFPVSRETVFVTVPVLFLMTLVAVLPVLLRGKASRWQGVVLLLSYAAYLCYLVVVQPI
jgi:cation:H+ antiporter